MPSPAFVAGDFKVFDVSGFKPRMATYDIAQVLKCSEATVRVHLHRALATLKKTMEKR